MDFGVEAAKLKNGLEGSEVEKLSARSKVKTLSFVNCEARVGSLAGTARWLKKLDDGVWIELVRTGEAFGELEIGSNPCPPNVDLKVSGSLF